MPRALLFSDLATGHQLLSSDPAFRMPSAQKKRVVEEPQQTEKVTPAPESAAPAVSESLKELEATIAPSKEKSKEKKQGVKEPRETVQGEKDVKQLEKLLKQEQQKIAKLETDWLTETTGHINTNKALEATKTANAELQRKLTLRDEEYREEVKEATSEKLKEDWDKERNGLKEEIKLLQEEVLKVKLVNAAKVTSKENEGANAKNVTKVANKDGKSKATGGEADHKADGPQPIPWKQASALSWIDQIEVIREGARKEARAEAKIELELKETQVKALRSINADLKATSARQNDRLTAKSQDLEAKDNKISSLKIEITTLESRVKTLDTTNKVFEGKSPELADRNESNKSSKSYSHVSDGAPASRALLNPLLTSTTIDAKNAVLKFAQSIEELTVELSNLRKQHMKVLVQMNGGSK